MFVRTFVALAIFALPGNGLLAQESKPSINIGDRLIIRMTGDVANEYARRSGRQTPTANGTRLVIETPATVSERLSDKHYRIEHSCPINIENKPQRLVTLSAIVDPTKIVGSIAPREINYSSPPTSKKNVVEPVAERPDDQTRKIELSDLREVKLQTWELVIE
jgi:hypothetical protein